MWRTLQRAASSSLDVSSFYILEWDRSRTEPCPGVLGMPWPLPLRAGWPVAPLLRRIQAGRGQQRCGLDRPGGQCYVILRRGEAVAISRQERQERKVPAGCPIGKCRNSKPRHECQGGTLKRAPRVRWRNRVKASLTRPLLRLRLPTLSPQVLVGFADSP